MIIVFLLMLLILAILGLILLKNRKKSWLEITACFAYILSLFFLGFGLLMHGHQYDQSVDPVDGNCYIPWGGKHILSVLVYFVLYHMALAAVWLRGRRFPPLLAVLFIIIIVIGLAINGVNMVQILHHATWPDQHRQGDDGAALFFLPATIFSSIIGYMMLVKLGKEEKLLSEDRHFRNAFLEKCNRFLATRYNPMSWAFIFLLPVFLLFTLILLLFGQDYDSMVKVYTETTSWTFSQKMHPPPLDHRGHYLCTVSARGNPQIVKPLFIGKRHGQPLIVNRQLQIANAFEEMVSDFSPKIHRFIRRNYDRYGYNLSVKINNERRSNLTYILMKPLEWLFLLCLYLGTQHPEAKIKKQYAP